MALSSLSVILHLFLASKSATFEGDALSILATRRLALEDLAHTDNSTRKVTGQLTSLPANFKDKSGWDNAHGFSIQDATGGLIVYVPDQDFYDADPTKFADLEIGRWVTVWGYINTNKPAEVVDEGGLVRIYPKDFGSITLGDLGDEVIPKEIGVDEVGDYQGHLVQITNVNISHELHVGEWGKDFRAEDKDGKGTSIWFYPSWADSYPEVGTQYEYIIGFASVYLNCSDSHILEDVWEIWPRSEMDWKEDSSQAITHYLTGAIMITLLFSIY
eukprot:209242_1